MVPSLSADPVASKVHARKEQVVVKVAVGMALVRTTATGWTTEPVVASSSVTVSVTLRVPEVTKSWLGVAPVAVPPSPKSHAYDATEPSGSLDPVPSKPQTVLSQLKVNDAVGAWFGSSVRR